MLSHKAGSYAWPLSRSFVVILLQFFNTVIYKTKIRLKIRKWNENWRKRQIHLYTTNMEPDAEERSRDDRAAIYKFHVWDNFWTHFLPLKLTEWRDVSTIFNPFQGKLSSRFGSAANVGEGNILRRHLWA